MSEIAPSRPPRFPRPVASVLHSAPSVPRAPHRATRVVVTTILLVWCCDVMAADEVRFHDVTAPARTVRLFTQSEHFLTASFYRSGLPMFLTKA